MRSHHPAWFAWHGAWYGGLLVFMAMSGAWALFALVAVLAATWVLSDLARRPR